MTTKELFEALVSSLETEAAKVELTTDEQGFYLKSYKQELLESLTRTVAHLQSEHKLL